MKTPAENFQSMAASAEKFESTFGHLSEAQLNWKINPETWSIAQVLEHLIITKASFFQQLDDLSKSKYKKPFWSFLGGFLSNLVLSAVKNDRKKVKAPPLWSNVQSKLPAMIIRMYRQNMSEFLKLSQAAAHKIKPEETYLVSPALFLITYRFDYGMEILAVHEERHFKQALAVMNHSGFPKA